MKTTRRPSVSASARVSERSAAPRDGTRRRLLAGLLGLSAGTALVGAIAAGGGRLSAEPLPPAVVAVVNYQRLLREARAARQIREEIEARRRRYQEEIKAKERELLDKEREIARQRSLLSPEAYARKRREFEREAAAVQREVQERRRRLDAASASAYAEVRNAIIEVVGELAQERGFNLVLPSTAVLLFSPRLDLTEEVLAGIDARLPRVEVPEVPAEGTE